MIGYYPTRLIEEVHPDGRATWFAEYPELRGCHAVGHSQSEALSNLVLSAEAWLEWAAQQGLPIPEPCEGPVITVEYGAYGERPDARTTTRTELQVEELGPVIVESAA